MCTNLTFRTDKRLQLRSGNSIKSTNGVWIQSYVAMLLLIIFYATREWRRYM